MLPASKQNGMLSVTETTVLNEQTVRIEMINTKFLLDKTQVVWTNVRDAMFGIRANSEYLRKLHLIADNPTFLAGVGVRTPFHVPRGSLTYQICCQETMSP